MHQSEIDIGVLSNVRPDSVSASASLDWYETALAGLPASVVALRKQLDETDVWLPTPMAELDINGVQLGGDGESGLFNLRLSPGETLAVLDPHRACEHPLWRLLSGQDLPVAGMTRLGGVLLEQCTEQIGLVSRAPSWRPWRRVIDELMQGRKDGHARQAVRDALQVAGLAGCAQCWPWQLSCDQRYLVALVRALLAEPTLLLLEAPGVALAAETRQARQRLLRVLRAGRPITTVLFTNDAGDAVASADRVLLMQDARLVLDERPARGATRCAVSSELLAVELRLRAQLMSICTSLR